MKKKLFILTLILFSTACIKNVKAEDISIYQNKKSYSGTRETCTATSRVCVVNVAAYRVVLVNFKGEKLEGTNVVDIYDKGNDGSVFASAEKFKEAIKGQKIQKTKVIDYYQGKKIKLKAAAVDSSTGFNTLLGIKLTNGNSKDLQFFSDTTPVSKFYGMGWKNLKSNLRTIVDKIFPDDYFYKENGSSVAGNVNIGSKTDGNYIKFLEAVQNSYYLQVEPLYIAQIQNTTDIFSGGNKFKSYYGTATEIAKTINAAASAESSENKLAYTDRHEKKHTYRLAYNLYVDKFSDRFKNLTGGGMFNGDFIEVTKENSIRISDIEANVKKSYGVSFVSLEPSNSDVPTPNGETAKCYKIKKTPKAPNLCGNNYGELSYDETVEIEPDISKCYSSSTTAYDVHEFDFSYRDGNNNDGYTISPYGRRIENEKYAMYLGVYCTQGAEVTLPGKPDCDSNQAYIKYPFTTDFDSLNAYSFVSTTTMNCGVTPVVAYNTCENGTGCSTMIEKYVEDNFYNYQIYIKKSEEENANKSATNIAGIFDEVKNVLKVDKNTIFAGFGSEINSGNVKIKYNNKEYSLVSDSFMEKTKTPESINVLDYATADESPTQLQCPSNYSKNQQVPCKLENYMNLINRGVEFSAVSSTKYSINNNVEYSHSIKNSTTASNTTNQNNDKKQDVGIPLVKKGYCLLNESNLGDYSFTITPITSIGPIKVSSTEINTASYACTCNYSVKSQCKCPSNTKHSGMNAYQEMCNSTEKTAMTCAEAIDEYCNTDNDYKNEGIYESCKNDKGESIDKCLINGKTPNECLKNKTIDKYYCDDNTKTDITECVNTKIGSGTSENEAERKCVDEICGCGAKKQKFIYRTISLATPFVGKYNKGTVTGFNLDNIKGRQPGSNWNSKDLVKTKIIDTREIYNKKPMYAITLDSNAIKKIRSYNDKTEYSDFKLNCDATSTKCISSFVHEKLKELGALSDGSKCNEANVNTFDTCKEVQ